MSFYFPSAVVKLLAFFGAAVFLLVSFPGHLQAADIYPLPIEQYFDQQWTDLWLIYQHRMELMPFNLLATTLFFLAIAHTFASGMIGSLGKRLERREHAKVGAKNPRQPISISVLSASLQLLGEIELVFAFWVVILAGSMAYFFDWQTFVDYIEKKVNFTEPVFIVVIIAICSTRPVAYFAERILGACAKLLKAVFRTQSGAYWWAILCLGSLLGSFITEPAAITIAAYLLTKHFFPFTKKSSLLYYTFAVLLLNVSLGGSFTHYAAPPIFMVADSWGLTLGYVFSTFGLRSLLVILITSSFGLVYYYREFKRMDSLPNKTQPAVVLGDRLPSWVILVHLLFIFCVVANAHHLVIFVGAFIIFIGFMRATSRYQYRLDMRQPLLIGLFLAGLIIHGGLQTWWIEPLLKRLTTSQSFLVSAFLSSFNDNAAITYLASLVPNFPVALRASVLAGAIAGGGLTVLANTPNLTAYSLLEKYFPHQRLSHFRLLIYAIPPFGVALAVYLWL